MWIEKNCKKCDRIFTPSSRHVNCPSCRKILYKKECKCGTLIQRISKFCIKCANEGEFNGRWRGGKTKHTHGYLMCKVKDHPRSGRNNGYIFEHALVMEEKIGRYLLDNENVHHLNGVRTDNRIENLELWTKPQPSGIRAEDAISWAKEILKRYNITQLD